MISMETYMNTLYEDLELQDQVKKAVIRSQHCQRNFDLTKTIPQEDLDTLIHAATNCPSKQNISFYNLHVITDRNIIEQLHIYSPGTDAYNENNELIPTTNSQVLANVVFVYEQKLLNDQSISAFNKWKIADHEAYRIFQRDQDVAIGIASGYVNLTAALLGYSTGCCQCFLVDEIWQYLKLKNKPVMIQGIGFKDPTRNRRLHHENNLIFPTRKKEEISVTYHT